jgi:nucleoside-diphosphate-sugar epimerase
MRVFVTGASGWIGSAAVEELLAAGHDVTGLARSDASAAALDAKGVRVLRGDLDDLAALRAGAEAAEAVLHLGYKHDWSDIAASFATERAAVEAFGEVLAGSDRPLLLASGIAGLAQGRPATEQDVSSAHGPESPRGGAENYAMELAEKGVHTVSLRFAPTVHGAGDHGFISVVTGVAREKGVAAYPGDGTNRWAAVHRSDAARLITSALADAPAGSKLHVVGEEGVPTKEIAEAIGRVHGLPVRSVDPADVGAHFGWIGGFWGLDMAATSTATQKLLGWTPTGPTLLEDIDAGGY